MQPKQTISWLNGFVAGVLDIRAHSAGDFPNPDDYAKAFAEGRRVVLCRSRLPEDWSDLLLPYASGVPAHRSRWKGSAQDQRDEVRVLVDLYLQRECLKRRRALMQQSVPSMREVALRFVSSRRPRPSETPIDGTVVAGRTISKG